MSSAALAGLHWEGWRAMLGRPGHPLARVYGPGFVAVKDWMRVGCYHRTMKLARSSVSPVVEEYLQAIYNLAMEGEPVVGARLAERFGVSPPTVTATLKRMRADGLLADTHGEVALSDEGVAAAESSLRRHRLCERFLAETLGMDWVEAHEQAHHLEHALTPEIEASMVAKLGNPRTCPHGNPIPGAGFDPLTYLREQNAVRLSDAPAGRPFRVVSISEMVEDETALLRYLGERGVRPGAALRVVEHAPGGGPTVARLDRDGQTVALAHAVAHKLWVAPL